MAPPLWVLAAVPVVRMTVQLRRGHAYIPIGPISYWITIYLKILIEALNHKSKPQVTLNPKP